MSLQKRYEQTEDELRKKRAELRELLRQENSGNPTPPDSAPPSQGATASSHLNDNPDNGLSAAQRSSVTLELLTESAELRRSSNHSANSSNVAGASGMPEPPVRKSNFSSLPKIEVKTPAQIIEEKERSSTGGVSFCGSTSSPSSTRSSFSSAAPAGHVGASTGHEKLLVSQRSAESPMSLPIDRPESGRPASQHRGSDILESQSQRHRSGTPLSTKSKVNNIDSMSKLTINVTC